MYTLQTQDAAVMKHRDHNREKIVIVLFTNAIIDTNLVTKLLKLTQKERERESERESTRTHAHE
jgi:hypothetical protein